MTWHPSDHSHNKTMCDSTTEPIELLCGAVKGSVPLGQGGTKTEGSVNTGLFMKKLFFVGRRAVPWRHDARLTGLSRTHLHARAAALSHTHVWANKEFERFILSAVDICGSFHGQNWLNLAAAK